MSVTGERCDGLMKFYTSSGALQISYVPPKYQTYETDDGQRRRYLKKEGCIMVQAAKCLRPPKGQTKGEWDWDNKILFAISFTDICQLNETEEEVGGRKIIRLRSPKDGSRRVFHKFNDNAKTIQIKRGSIPFTWMVEISQKQNGKWSNVTVPLSDGEHHSFMRFLATMQPALTGITP